MEQAFTNAHNPCMPLSDQYLGQTFSLPMPPPNITGKLHLGHALDLNLQDTLIRWYAQRSAQTRWTPGSDHAGLATHEKILGACPHLQGHTFTPGSRTSDPLYRDYMNAAHEWTQKHQGIIFEQFGALHPYTSLSAPRFTMDDAYQRHALTALAQLQPYLRWEEGHLLLDLKESRHALMDALERCEIRCEPAGHKQRLLAMLREDRPWDIGRSIPWGLPIPAWCHELPGSNPEQLTLDTWFNSSLWPSAMHPDEATPLDALITGYDIAFFWGARMCMMHHALYGSWPFKEIRLHGLIRDEHGQKFSKSLGNGIDPLDILSHEGSDALRIWCLENAAWGRDIRCKREDIFKCGALPTKMLNASRWLLMNQPSQDIADAPALTPWSFDQLDEEIERLMNNYELDKAWKCLRKAAWSQWCEGWLMQNKEAIRGSQEGWRGALGLHRQWLTRLHPFMPASTWWLDDALQEYYIE